MALDRQRQVFRRHADAVIDHLYQGLAAGAERHVDARGTRVDRVLDQFLDRVGRALDHLAGGDPVDQAVWQAAERHAPTTCSPAK